MLYHVTKEDGFRGIICNHSENRLEFWLSHYKDMNDPNELKQLFHYENDKNTIKFSDNICQDYYILCMTEDPMLTYDHKHGDYGNIILGLDTAYIPHQGVTFMKCDYNDNDMPMPSRIQDPMENLFYYFYDRIDRFFVKRREWNNEAEWRWVENAQIGESVHPPREGKKHGYIIRSFPHDMLKRVYLREDIIDKCYEITQLLKDNLFDVPIAVLHKNGRVS